eukprot:9500095-Pyramimonas_sp.AAC.2
MGDARAMRRRGRRRGMLRRMPIRRGEDWDQQVSGGAEEGHERRPRPPREATRRTDWGYIQIEFVCSSSKLARQASKLSWGARSSPQQAFTE